MCAVPCCQVPARRRRQHMPACALRPTQRRAEVCCTCCRPWQHRGAAMLHPPGCLTHRALGSRKEATEAPALLRPRPRLAPCMARHSLGRRSRSSSATAPSMAPRTLRRGLASSRGTKTAGQPLEGPSRALPAAMLHPPGRLTHRALNSHEKAMGTPVQLCPRLLLAPCMARLSHGCSSRSSCATGSSPWTLQGKLAPSQGPKTSKQSSEEPDGGLPALTTCPWLPPAALVLPA
mmetsp:Transcript_54068/g.167360  ORF Transcript_54068/g.167360 Transcript_54068/m.167360 type:complete len:234 (-) Transcript_54068:439-1140(-)